MNPISTPVRHPAPLTLGQLLAALQDASRSDAEAVAACADLMRRGAVVAAR